MVSADLHEVYGIDTGDPVLMSERSWWWLRDRINGLLNRPPVFLPDGRPGPSTRIGWVLNPPPPPSQTSEGR